MSQSPALGAGVAVPTPPPGRHDHHFATDHLIGDLKGRSVRGGAVTLTSQAIKFVLQMGSTMVLARLLSPNDFGLIAMVTAITGFVAMFKDAGLSMATVQRENITHGQVSTLFWINLGLSAAVMLVVAAMAPLIAGLYSESRLVWVTLALACTMMFGGCSVQHQALLQRQMRFRALAVVDIASMIGGTLVAIAMALMGCGYWALVGLTAATSLLNAAMVWQQCGWRPGPPMRHCGTGPMLMYGGNLTGFNAINYWARNADNMLIGWYWGAGPLGLYSKAYGLLMLPIRQINGPLTAVMVPALSRRQVDPAAYRRMYRRAITSLALAGMPLVGFLYVAADEIVRLVLGPRFIDAVPMFRALSIAAFVGTTNVAPGWLYITLGHTHRQLKWSIISTPLLLACMAGALPLGPTGVAWAFSFGYVVVWLGGIAYCVRGTFMRVSDVVGSLWPIGLATLFITALISAVVPSRSTGSAISLLTKASAYGTSLLGLSLAVPRLRDDILQTLRMLASLRHSKNV